MSQIHKANLLTTESASKHPANEPWVKQITNHD